MRLQNHACAIVSPQLTVETFQELQARLLPLESVLLAQLLPLKVVLPVNISSLRGYT